MGASAQRTPEWSLSLTVVLRPEAQDEIRDAHAWYEDAQFGLGERFIAQLDALITRISRSPEHFPQAFGFKRAIVPSFPYCVYFRSGSDTVVIVAVLHGRRNPLRLRRRR